MRKLMRANFERLWKNKLFWAGMAVMVLYCVFLSVGEYVNTRKYDAYIFAEYVLFGFLPVVGVLVSVFISQFVGTEYSDGTIRNKIVTGQSRNHIYLTELFGGAVMTVTVWIVSILTMVLLGFLLFDGFRMNMGHLMMLTILSLFSCLIYTSVFHMIAMICPNKTHTAIINMLLAFGILFLGIYLTQSLWAPEMIEQAALTVNGTVSEFELVPNPNYISGVKREIYQFLCDILPGGQVIQIVSLDVLHPYRMIVGDVVIMLVSTVAGMFFLNKKDIK